MQSALMNLALAGTERGMFPDSVLRAGIRRLVAARRSSLAPDDCEGAASTVEGFVRQMDAAEIAPVPALANRQHYEVPADFFGQVLGPHRKYSSCWWPSGVTTLFEAEEAALAETCVRAALADGQRVLELGCGWGSLSLYMAARYPSSSITAVSNSRSQRAYIEGEASRRGLANLRVLTEDINAFQTSERFDRVVSVEMFEHLRNWRAMFARVASWLVPDGRFFMHVFCHRSVPYAFVDEGPSDWMTRHFFAGGMMPSDELPLRFQDGLRLTKRWRWDGTHYARTANAWLANMGARRAALWPVLERAYGRKEAALWWTRWRIFFMSCAELFGSDDGNCWWVSHYQFERRP